MTAANKNNNNNKTTIFNNNGQKNRNNKTAFQSKANHTQTGHRDTHFAPMTLTMT